MICPFPELLSSSTLANMYLGPPPTRRKATGEEGLSGQNAPTFSFLLLLFFSLRQRGVVQYCRTILLRPLRCESSIPWVRTKRVASVGFQGMEEKWGRMRIPCRCNSSWFLMVSSSNEGEQRICWLFQEPEQLQAVLFLLNSSRDVSASWVCPTPRMGLLFSAFAFYPCTFS